MHRPRLLRPVRSLALAALLPLVTGCISAREESFLVEEQLAGVIVELSSGEVELLGTASPEAWVSIEVGGIGTRPMDHRVEDGVLVLDLRCGGACGGDVLVEVPPGVWSEVHLNQGEVTTTDLDDELLLLVGSGEISVQGHRGQWVELATGAGEISAELLREPTLLRAEGGAGEVGLEVPAGRYALELEAGAGALHSSGVTHDPDSTHRIRASAGAGELWVEGVGRPSDDPVDL